MTLPSIPIQNLGPDILNRAVTPRIISHSSLTCFTNYAHATSYRTYRREERTELHRPTVSCHLVMSVHWCRGEREGGREGGWSSSGI